MNVGWRKRFQYFIEDFLRATPPPFDIAMKPHLAEDIA
jgi:hypothetical protein